VTGQIAVVTGAGSGIGRATAHALAAKGARVAICDVDRTRVEAVAAELGERVLVARAVDVSDRAQMEAFAAAVHEHAPAADVVVNNAGVAVAGAFLDTKLDDIDWLLGINLRGVVHGCHFFAPAMAERGRGQIVNIASIFGIFPAPNSTAYVASKFAVLGFSQSLRAELAPRGVGVTAICPGMIATQIVADARHGGEMETKRSKIVETFKTRGAPPSLVADAIVEAVRTNPAVRTVGRDARVVAAMYRAAPRLATRLAAMVARRT
jgi:NADP-dependent 3-hydroxy acid dehydrogenase YdfG